MKNAVRCCEASRMNSTMTSCEFSPSIHTLPWRSRVKVFARWIEMRVRESGTYFISSSLVFDDEDEHIITTGAVVTLTVHLQREDMSSVFNKEWTANTSSTINNIDDEVNEEQADDKENREKVKESRCWRLTGDIVVSIALLESRRIEGSSSSSECSERLDQQSG